MNACRERRVRFFNTQDFIGGSDKLVGFAKRAELVFDKVSEPLPVNIFLRPVFQPSSDPRNPVAVFVAAATFAGLRRRQDAPQPPVG